MYNNFGWQKSTTSLINQEKILITVKPFFCWILIFAYFAENKKKCENYNPRKLKLAEAIQEKPLQIFKKGT